MKKNPQSENILIALEHADKAQPSAALLLRMEKLAASYQRVNEKLTLRSMIGIAASVILLMALNVYVLTDTSKEVASETEVVLVDNADLLPIKYLYND